MPQIEPNVNGTFWAVIYSIWGVVMYERIRNLREDSDLTQQNMADMLFINRRTYSSYEVGKRGIPTEIICKIADIFNTSVDYLVGRTNTKKPYPKSDRSE